MTLATAVLERMAANLAEARQNHRPVSPLTDSYPELEEPAAYRVQEMSLGRSAERVGYKWSFTSAAVREQMGIAGPNYCRLMGDMQVSLVDERVKLPLLIHPSVEPEIAMFVHRDLIGPRIGPAQVRRAVRWVAPSLEVVDPRFAGYRLRASDNTADNSSAARFALGSPVPLSSVPDLPHVRARLHREEEEVDHGLGANAMGDPLAAVAWLANKLDETGDVLETGSVVLTGGLARAHRVSQETDVSADLDDLGSVRLRFGGSANPLDFQTTDQ